MKYRSGSIAKEVLVVVLTFLAIVSGAIFVFTSKNYPSQVEKLLSSKNENSVQNIANTTAPADKIVNKSLNINVNKVGSMTGQLLHENINVNNNNVNAVIVQNTPPVQNLDKRSTNETIELGKNISLQAFAQKKLGVEYLVVKTTFTENKIFETLTPFVSKLKIDRYILQKGGTSIGYLYEVKKIDQSIQNAYIFLKDLGEKILKNPKITISDAPTGKRSFYYNNVDKPELLRIVVESRSGVVFGLDIPSALQQDFKEFLR